MAFDLQVLDSKSACFYTPCSPDNEASSTRNSGFVLYLGSEVDRFVTSGFQLPNSEIRIKLKIWRNSNSSAKEMAIQLLLVEPEHDAIGMTINGKSAVLTDGSDSFIVYHSGSSVLNLQGNKENVTSYLLKITTSNENPWKSSFKCLDSGNAANIALKMGAMVIRTQKELLVDHSDVFAVMFGKHFTSKIPGAMVMTTMTMAEAAKAAQWSHSGIVEIDSFSFEVVQEMIRFMKHGYCCVHPKTYEQLLAIAEKYNVKGPSLMIAMKTFVAGRKSLMEQLF